MAMIGVAHCPSCGAMVNTRWATCQVCSSGLGDHTSESMALPAEGPMELVARGTEILSRQTTIKTGMTVQYRIPVEIKDYNDYTWEEHTGKVKRIDANRELVLVIPETEEEPWRWVAMCYVSKGTE